MKCTRALALFALMALSESGCSKHSPANGTSNVVGSKPTVAVVQPKKQTITVVIELPGHFEAFEQTPIYSRIGVYVEKVHVDIQDIVKPGQPLVDLNVPELEADVIQKAALVAQSIAEVKQAEAAAAAAAAKVTTAIALKKEAEAGRKRAQALYERWDKEFKRVTKLVKEKTLDDSIYEETERQYKAADAAREEVEAKIESAEAHRLESVANLAKAEADSQAAKDRQKVAEAALQSQKALAAYMHIKAPYPGIVTLRNIHTGRYVQPPSGESSTPLLVVERIDKVRVVTEVPETEAGLINTGMPLTVRIAALGGLQFTEKVARTSQALDSRVRTLRLEADRKNTDDFQLKSGLYCFVSMEVKHENVWTLLRSAVFMHGERYFCCRVKDNKILRTPVQVVMKNDNLVEVAGIEEWVETDWCIIGNPANLNDGQEVDVK
jgi:RND family efflux transporter MFP subunit